MRVKAVAAMDESNPALERLAGDLVALTSDVLASTARIMLAIQEPTIKNRLPRIVFIPSVTPKYRGYLTEERHNVSIQGESVSFVLSWAGKAVAAKEWSTEFPSITEKLEFLPAEVHGEDLLKVLLKSAVFTQDDLAELCASEIPEVRRAAVGNLTDPALLARIAVQDQDAFVRKAAVGNLTDQAFLAKVAVEDNDKDVRRAAVENLTDRPLLVRVADSEKEWYVREVAVRKLTDQAALAVGGVTDEAALTQVAVTEANDFYMPICAKPP